MSEEAGIQPQARPAPQISHLYLTFSDIQGKINGPLQHPDISVRVGLALQSGWKGSCLPRS